MQDANRNSSRPGLVSKLNKHVLVQLACALVTVCPKDLGVVALESKWLGPINTPIMLKTPILLRL